MFHSTRGHLGEERIRNTEYHQNDKGDCIFRWMTLRFFFIAHFEEIRPGFFSTLPERSTDDK